MGSSCELRREVPARKFVYKRFNVVILTKWTTLKHMAANLAGL